ncbi:hypothetical protein [Streptomyces sp. NPDC059894]|uniref:hypothetical protein n=1 Tax=unclassified Streptomyces TaxID=2593676 RepID=UPI003661FB16
MRGGAGGADTAAGEPGGPTPGRSSVVHTPEDRPAPELPDEPALKTRGGREGGPATVTMALTGQDE